MMKNLGKMNYSLIVLVFALLLSACRPSIEDINKNVTLEVAKNTVSPTGLTLIIKNNSFNSFMYGEDYNLFHEVSGQWMNVSMVTDEPYVILIGYPVPPISKKIKVIDWEKWYGELAPGQYRIGIEFTSSNDQNIKDFITTDFAISD